MESTRPLSVLIVDDEPLARTRLSALLSDLQSQIATTVVGESGNGKDALRQIEALNPDVVLLDVQMPGMNGVEVARHAALIKPQPPVIIFSTAFDEFALQAFEVQAIDYLVKPVRATRLFDALERARRRIDERNAVRVGEAAVGTETLGRVAKMAGLARRHISVSERGKLFLVPVMDVVYFRAEMKYTTIRTRDREYLTEESLSTLENEFGDLFLRIHRNALVARDAITGSVKGAGGEADDGEGGDNGWNIVLRGVPETLPVSRRQWAHVKALLKL